ncbi:MAG: aspartyl protease family protein [Deinococcales bacterium]|nr:aspartyl protease family protein [Chitinophagaceae bacterium]
MLHSVTNICFIKKLKFGLVLLLCTKLYAQEEFVLPQSKFLTKFSFTQLSGGIIILRATVDNIKDSLNFVLDTGSGGISLDSTTVAAFGFKRSKSDKTIRGIAGIKNVEFTNNHTLRLPGINVENLDFHINDYELLTSVYGVKIDGIIGFSFLRRYIITINYDDLKIEIYSPGTMKYPRGGYLMKPNFASLAYPQASVSDEREIFNRFIFDTGAGLCMLLSEDFIADSALLKKNRKKYQTQTEGLGGKKTMDITVINQVQIGSYKFKKVPVYIFSDDFNVTNYPLLGGLIGNDLLRRFNVVLNYPDQSIYLKPNTHFNDAFDYSYTGLGIYQIENDVTVIDIIPNSPGDVAGFKSGDLILSIDNVFSKNIQAFKNALQNSGNKIKILVLRNGLPIILTLKVKNILRNK